MNSHDAFETKSPKAIKIAATDSEDVLTHFLTLLYKDWLGRISESPGQIVIKFSSFSQLVNMNYLDAYNLFNFLDSENTGFLPYEDFINNMSLLFKYKSHDLWEEEIKNKNKKYFHLQNVNILVLAKFVDELKEGLEFVKSNLNLKTILRKMFQYNDGVSKGIFVIQKMFNRELVQVFLVLDGNYIYNYAKEYNTFYSLTSIFLLRGYFPYKSGIFKYNNKDLFPLAMTLKYSSPICNSKNIFIFPDKSERKIFHKILKNKLEIKNLKKEYEFLHKIGSGSYGKVYKVAPKTKEGLIYIKTGGNESTFKAIKKIQKEKFENSQAVLNEINVVKFLIDNPHENITKFYNIYEERNHIYIVMELMEANLKSHLSTDEKKSIDINSVMMQLVKGLKFLHSNKIIHRDIKLGNILTTTKNNEIIVKICDFGLSGFFLNEEAYGSMGTLNYAAPEILKGKVYNNKVDIWSLGIVLCKIVNGKNPFSGLTEKETRNNIINKVSLELDLTINNDHYYLMTQFLNKNVKERFDIDQTITYLTRISV